MTKTWTKNGVQKWAKNGVSQKWPIWVPVFDPFLDPFLDPLFSKSAIKPHMMRSQGGQKVVQKGVDSYTVCPYIMYVYLATPQNQPQPHF